MDPAPRLARLRWRAALAGVLGAAALASIGAGASSAGATATTAATTSRCPTFRVIHADRIGAADFPAGTYSFEVTAANLSCKNASELFARFLEDYDGVLPRPYKVVAEGSGKASFTQGGQPGFSVALTKSAGAGEGGENGASPVLGTLCNGTFSVNSNVVVGPLRFTKGKFLIYLPPKTGISCRRASLLFTRFLAATPDLPSPWRLENQTATFYKPSNPTRSAFRIEPLDGSGVR